MASRIQGITIQIDGDTTKLQSALKGVDKTLRTTQNNLRDINKLLKLDPKNTDLLRQKQQNLQTAIKTTKQRLTELKDAQSQVQKGTAEWDGLQREIIATEQNLKKLESEYKSFGSVAKQQVLAVGQQMKELGDKISNAGQKFAPVSKAAAGLLAGMGAMGVKAVTAADDLNTLAKQTGLSTKEIQQMQYASDRIDVSFENVVGAMKKMKPKMTDTNETFKQLGVSIKDSDGNLRSAKDVFYDSVKALSQISNETERDQIAMELFGKSADDLAGIIDDGGAGLKEYGDEAERLGLILDQETLDSLNKTNDELDKMKAQFKAAALKAGAKIAEAAAPLVEKVAAGVEKLVGWLDKLTPQQAELVMKVLAVVAAIAPVLIIGGKIVRLIGGIITAVGALMSPLGLIVIAIAAAIAIGVALYKNWDKIRDSAKKFVKEVSKGWQQLKKDVSTAANNLKTSVVNAWNSMKTAVINAWNNLKTTVVNGANALKTSVVNTWNSMKTSVINTWNSLKTSVVNGVNSLKTSVVNAWNSLKSSVVSVVSSLQSSVVSAWNTLKSSVTSIVSNIRNSVVTTWSNISSSVSSTVSSLISAATTSFNNFKSSVANIFENVRSSIVSKIESAKQSVQNIFDRIKSVFDTVLTIKLKVPHISIDGGEAPWGIGGEGRKPSFHVDWYRRAYNNPMLFTSPTVLSTPNGYKGFGDGNGAEIVMGLNKLRELVGSYGANGVTINVYAQPGMDVNQLANKIQDRFIALQKQRSLAYA